MKAERQVPVVTLRPIEAAQALGVSASWFNRHVATEVPQVRKGGMVLYKVDALIKWADNNTDWGK